MANDMHRRALVTTAAFLHAGRSCSRAVPVGDTAVTQLLLMIYPSHLMDVTIGEPSELVWVDAENGALAAHERFDRARFGLPAPTNPRAIGRRKTAGGRSHADWMHLLNELESATEILAPWFWRRAPAIDDGAAVDARVFYLREFDGLVEQGLGPYYRAVGKDWFTWLTNTGAR